MTDETPARRTRGRTHHPPEQVVPLADEAQAAAEAAEAQAVAEALAEIAGTPVAAADDAGHGSTAPVASPDPLILEGPQERLAATSIRVERGGIEEATADSVDVRLGGIGRLRADDVHVQWGGIGAGRADTMSVEFGSVGAAMARDLRVTQGIASNVVAKDATLEQGFVRTMIAQHVTISRPSAVLVMVAFKVTGDIRPLLDWRGALAAGAAFALVSGVFKLLRVRRSS